jgi:hypothetical protein
MIQKLVYGVFNRKRKIVNLYKGDYPRDVEKMIKKLLRNVPEDNLVGLQSIVIVNKSAQKKLKNAPGLYVPKSRRELQRVEIAVDNFF